MYSKTSVMRASSYQFCIATIVGCILCYLAILVFPINNTDASCASRHWILTLGLSMVIAPILGTQRRIDYIFNVKLLKIVIMNDVKVWAYIAYLMVPQILINILWSAISNPVSVLVVPDIYRPALNYYFCPLNDVGVIFMGLCLAYFFLMLCSVVYFAFRIRHVQDRFNEAKTLTMTVYTITLTWGVLIAIMFAIKDEVLSYYVRSLVVLVSCSLVQLILFVPKIARIHAERDGTASELEVSSTGISHNHPKKEKSTTVHDEKKNTEAERIISGIESRLTTALADDTQKVPSWRNMLSEMQLDLRNLREALFHGHAQTRGSVVIAMSPSTSMVPRNSISRGGSPLPPNNSIVPQTPTSSAQPANPQTFNQPTTPTSSPVAFNPPMTPTNSTMPLNPPDSS